MNQREINENTAIPLKGVIPIISAIVAATVWITSQLWEIRAAQRNVWTQQQMQVWRDKLQNQNRTVITVPDVADMRP